MERHLNLNGRDTALIWIYSQVGRRCCFHSQSATLGAARSRCNVRVYGAGDNSKRVTSGSQFTTMKQNVGSKGSESGKPRRRILAVKRPIYATQGAAAKVCSIPHSANGRATWPFLLLRPRRKYKRVYSACRFPSLSILRSLSCSMAVN